ncbi:MAG: peptidase M28 [Acidobacteria bacterium RIFCSPLOWO2_12_FULL_65_11]|nr:MAG: peptidase M28 [Acidobacteria bacterium RIFCSPLOWO2_02_FULL_64_15]OFW28302.1 MAG: peptidase M28 [Acidobacteria bacterium RIFCSPLOWO2_12_FULL_65_11]
MSMDVMNGVVSIASLRRDLNTQAIGAELYDRIRRLYPICRSITGKGLRDTLGLIGQEIDLETREVPSGTQAFDWIVPKEWNVQDAYVKDRDGVRVVDFNASNLHVVQYSMPVRRRMTLAELRPHLFSIPERPDWIPYKTSYYRETWGFCLSHRQLQALVEDEYDVCIDSSLAEGHLTLGECVLPGREADEILFSCHACHPSLCNDNLSGVSTAVTLAKLLTRASRRYTYRFLFIPGTIGAITWLALHEQTAARIRNGLVLSCLGDRGKPTYKRSRRGLGEIDRAAVHVLGRSGDEHEIQDFSPYGYDERQYCSPGFDLPVGVLSRTPHGCFPEYHTSADNLSFMDPAKLSHSLITCLEIVEVLEGNGVYVNRNPKCEPQLGRRGLYRSAGGHGDVHAMETALLWVLNLSDGRHSLLDIAERSGLRFETVRQAADLLAEHELLTEAAAPRSDPAS